MYSEEEKQTALEYGIKFDGYGGLEVNNYVISAYTYLLDYYSDSKVKSFLDFKAIHKNADTILQRINNDLSRDRMMIQCSRNESRETAEADANKVREAVLSIVSFINELSK